MNSQRGGPHAFIWALVVIVAAPVLYLITYPPLKVVTGTRHINGVKTADYLSSYSQPWHWMIDTTPFQPSMATYYQWWVDALEPWQTVHQL
jgi:hypothetical protein